MDETQPPELTRLQARLDRERRARREAEAIAEKATRALYDGQQDLMAKTASVQLLQTVAIAANQAVTVEEAMQIALDRVCAYTGWPVGHAYLVADDFPVELVPTTLWHLDDPEGFETFRRVTEVTRLRRGVGLPGRVLATGNPAWIIDVLQDPNFPRAEVATDIGVRAGFAFPVLVGDEVAAVLEFFADSAIEPDEALLVLMGNVGTQLGRVIERTRAAERIRRAKVTAEAATQAKSTFLANMSHELRTPLNGIIGFAELMHDAKLGPITSEQQEYMADILTSARHLLHLINDVLDLAKVESGKMEFRPEPVDIARMADEVTDILRTLAAQKRIHVGTEIDPAVSGVVIDPAKLKQVFYNYVSNALKFTPDEGWVTIRVAAAGADEFRLDVEDTGIGIKPDDISKLFTEFQQLNAGVAKKSPGTGLGLALTKRIVEAQGGRIGATSVFGQGSCFFAVLPRRARQIDATEVQLPPTPSPGPDPRNRR